jgi:hypothetical protein
VSLRLSRRRNRARAVTSAHHALATLFARPRAVTARPVFCVVVTVTV